MESIRIRKIVYITGTRADYGLMRPVLLTIQNSNHLELELIVTGMHIMEEFGSTVNEIKNDKFKINIINTVFEEDDKYSMVNFIGKFIILLTKKLKLIKPDIILLLGDRAEMLAGAIVGTYLNIPVAHIHGGDITSTVDEHARHAITKLAHIHFPATKKSAERIIKMGEEEWRVHNVGSPAIDSLLYKNFLKPNILVNKYNINLKEPILLVIQHPVSVEYVNSASQIKQTLEALKELEYQSIVVYPNSDAGGRSMINVIKEYENYPFIKTYENIPHMDYLSLMKIADLMIGNSSSGIIEAPMFNLPVINIGTRQSDRERDENIIDVNYNKNEIKNAINKVLVDKKIKKTNFIYGDGTASKKILDILVNLDINENLVQKKINY